MIPQLPFTPTTCHVLINDCTCLHLCINVTSPNMLNLARRKKYSNHGHDNYGFIMRWYMSGISTIHIIFEATVGVCQLSRGPVSARVSVNNKKFRKKQRGQQSIIELPHLVPLYEQKNHVVYTFIVYRWAEGGNY